MRLRVRRKSGKDLSNRYLLIGYTEESVLHLTVGKEYVALAISLWRSCLQVLVSDDNELPNWYPVECFDLLDGRMPGSWLFRCYDGTDLEALWGYPTLVLEDDHYDQLLSRNESAMRIFSDELRAASHWVSET
jgi:hypothetical protein